jgi:hypothetical protein
MFDFTFDEDTIKDYGRKFRRYTQKHLEVALNDIKRDWIADLQLQQRTGRSLLGWPPLKPDYAKRKTREYQSGKIPYNSLLRRTGVMLAGYISAVEVDMLNYTVKMPYPRGEANTRAKAHQGEIGQPKGMPIRPFDIERFYDIAVRHMDRIYDNINNE